MEYNIYCDESCHLEHDDSNAMSLGAIWLPKERIAEVNQDIKAIKKEHGLSSYCETKWTKTSPSKETLCDIIGVMMRLMKDKYQSS